MSVARQHMHRALLQQPFRDLFWTASPEPGKRTGCNLHHASDCRHIDYQFRLGLQYPVTLRMGNDRDDTKVEEFLKSGENLARYAEITELHQQVIAPTDTEFGRVLPQRHNVVVRHVKVAPEAQLHRAIQLLAER